MSEDQEDRFRRKLAKWLGITYDELEEYGEDVEANDGEDGNEKYGYYIEFSKATPTGILDKMDRIDRKRIVYFNLEELED